MLHLVFLFVNQLGCTGQRCFDAKVIVGLFG